MLLKHFVDADISVDTIC